MIKHIRCYSESGWRVYGNSLYNFATFCKSDVMLKQKVQRNFKNQKLMFSHTLNYTTNTLSKNNNQTI